MMLTPFCLTPCYLRIDAFALDAFVGWVTLPVLHSCTAWATGGRLQPVLMRHTPQLSVKPRGGGV